jgi:hypothetical protein
MKAFILVLLENQFVQLEQVSGPYGLLGFEPAMMLHRALAKFLSARMSAIQQNPGLPTCCCRKAGILFVLL